MRLDGLFKVYNGLATTDLDILTGPSEGSVVFLRPASTQQRTIAGWVKRTTIPPSQIFPSETLFVSTNGEGSHSYAYVSSFEFACNSDVSALLPLAEMTLSEKIFYARCITLNRFKFSYGRKPKGVRLKSIDLPDFPRDWADLSPPSIIQSAQHVVDRDKTSDTKTAQIVSKNPAPLLAPLNEIFDIRNGHGLDLASLERVDQGGIRFISRAKRNNGTSAQVKHIGGLDPNPGGELTCALSGEGGVLFTFLQEEPFYTAYHVACLRPKCPMTREEMLYYCVCIKANRFRYSFGRQANRTLRFIQVPDPSTIPSWVRGSLSRVVEGISSSNQDSSLTP